MFEQVECHFKYVYMLLQSLICKTGEHFVWAVDHLCILRGTVFWEIGISCRIYP